MAVLNFSCIHLALLFFLYGVVYCLDGGFAKHNDKCHFRGNDELEYSEEIYFNKEMWLWYNSTTDIWKGDTTYGMEIANDLNNEPSKHVTRNILKYILCVENGERLYGYLHNYTVQPNVRLRSEEPASSRHSAMLVCSAYDFYPKTIIITWLRNGQVVTSDVSSTGELANGDWSYQIHSHLEYTPTPGEKISCRVEHYSLPEPQLYDWDPSIPTSEKSKIAIGASGLLLGLVFLLAGLRHYMKNRIGHRQDGPVSASAEQPLLTPLLM
ncbi:hypothetical protein UPYG_G00156520 [Umbra pygmaea]|uniref:Ig-like domain-containing protein n=1 Tax=Umbra pygmaea TaxID=75934 RepID=A0ABD0WYA5_UMBPY